MVSFSLGTHFPSRNSTTLSRHNPFLLLDEGKFTGKTTRVSTLEVFNEEHQYPKSNFG